MIDRFDRRTRGREFFIIGRLVNYLFGAKIGLLYGIAYTSKKTFHCTDITLNTQHMAYFVYAHLLFRRVGSANFPLKNDGGKFAKSSAVHCAIAC